MDRFVWLGERRPTRMDAGRDVPRHPSHPDAARGLGPRSLGDQEDTIGRRKYSGAPLGGRASTTPLDLEAGRNGGP